MFTPGTEASGNSRTCSWYTCWRDEFLTPWTKFLNWAQSRTLRFRIKVEKKLILTFRKFNNSCNYRIRGTFVKTNEKEIGRYGKSPRWPETTPFLLWLQRALRRLEPSRCRTGSNGRTSQNHPAHAKSRRQQLAGLCTAIVGVIKHAHCNSFFESD